MGERVRHGQDAEHEDALVADVPVRWLKNTRSQDEGAAAVEFALVVIPLLLIVFGIINFGVIFASQIGLNSSARDASRSGVVKPLNQAQLSCSEIAIAARNNGGAFPTNPTQIGVTVTGPGGTCSLAAGSRYGHRQPVTDVGLSMHRVHDCGQSTRS